MKFIASFLWLERRIVLNADFMFAFSLVFSFNNKMSAMLRWASLSSAVIRSLGRGSSSYSGLVTYWSAHQFNQTNQQQKKNTQTSDVVSFFYFLHSFIPSKFFRTHRRYHSRSMWTTNAQKYPTKNRQVKE